MKFRDYLLEEMFKSDKGYKATQRKDGNKIVFDIETDESRDYRFVFTPSGNETYIAELGYATGDKSGITNITSDFYDTNTLISTLISIFTGFYMSTESGNIIKYKFGKNTDKSYKLLVHSIIKKDLVMYFKIKEGSFDSDDLIIFRNGYHGKEE